MQPPSAAVPSAPPRWGMARFLGLAFAAALTAALLWSYWPTFGALSHRWSHDPQYSHGYVVPALALLVLWQRRARFPRGTARVSAWGVAVLAAAGLLRLTGAYFYLDWLDGLSLLLSLFGVAVLAGGWRVALWTAPAFAVLIFLLPPPFQVEIALAGPLQALATTVSTYALQTLGLPAVAEGNIIWIDDLQIGVLEACSGLGMLSAFFALSTTAALIVKRPAVERVAIFLSAVPIGIVMNLLRITATGLVYRTLGGEAAQTFFHDLAGWAMMPLAFAALWLELALLARLFTERPTVAGPVPLAMPDKAGAAAAPPAPARKAPSSALTV